MTHPSLRGVKCVTLVYEVAMDVYKEVCHQRSMLLRAEHPGFL